MQNIKVTRYSVQPRDRIYVKGYGILSFAKNMGKNIDKNISENLSGKSSQKPFAHARKSATDAFKTSSKRVIQETTEATSHSIFHKIANKITKVSKYLQQNNSETITNEHDKEIAKEKYERQKKGKKLLMNWD